MGEMGMHKVLVSACLLGQPVRYDGQSKGIVSDWLQALGAEGRVLAFSILVDNVEVGTTTNMRSVIDNFLVSLIKL